jgi:hypothetical protein
MRTPHYTCCTIERTCLWVLAFLKSYATWVDWAALP